MIEGFLSALIYLYPQGNENIALFVHWETKAVLLDRPPQQCKIRLQLLSLKPVNPTIMIHNLSEMLQYSIILH